MDKKSHPLVGITLAGFQVFEKSTYIPLTGLTLLFGPNSAGKSALQDAINLIREIWLKGSPDLAYFNPKSPLLELIARHRRRASGNEDVQFATMKIGFKTGNAEYLWTFSNEILPNFELAIDSIFLLKHRDPGAFEINLNHPSVPEIRKTSNMENVATNIPDEVRIRNDILILKRGIHGFRWDGGGKDVHGEPWLEFAVALDHEIDDLPNKQIKSIHKIVDEFSAPLKELLSSIEPNFDLNVVPASRTVPEARDLTFMFNHQNYDQNAGGVFSRLFSEFFRISEFDSTIQHFTTGKNIYKKLALSSLPYLEDADDEDYDPEIKKLVNCVNHALSNHLFIEHGYQVDCKYQILLSTGDSKLIHEAFSFRKKKSLAPKDICYLVNIFLRDNKGEVRLFEDVGSGIGYVLPVLCAIFDPIGDTTHFIQQPELHLHPALQAALGDVFIEASQKNSTVVIETHSEHLLLRILKRIRQTHLSVDIAQDLKISAEDVCVLYFDPSPDGTTTVKRLRISEDGEFMDRWPRGFFGERDQELLDE